ncbi:MAG: ethanolamine ammonia-lyase reactivating factor EutA [Thermodesulfobacteriota bacterium]
MISSLKAVKLNNEVAMIGLDFGSTTSSAMVALARVAQNSITGRMQFENFRVVYRCNPVFTPFSNTKINIKSLENYLNKWLKESKTGHESFFAGGAIVTGIAAKKTNTEAIARLIKQKIGRSVIATADDPRLESWLAFMGNSLLISKALPDIPVINIDIGGGTTNPALGINGKVISTGCSFIGARHFVFKPGTWQLTEISDWGMDLLDYLSIKKKIKEEFPTEEINSIINFYIKALEALVKGESDYFNKNGLKRYNQVPFLIDNILNTHEKQNTVITFSGGVGELVYKYSQGGSMPGTTHYGDLGIDIARAILKSKTLSCSIKDIVPENLGRATVYGLTLHNTQISGTTVFLSNPDALPLSDIPIVAGLGLNAGPGEINQALNMVKNCRQGGCIQIGSDLKNQPERVRLKSVKRLGTTLALGIKNSGFVKDLPLVLLVEKNFGKTLGNYASCWNTIDVNLVVIDEIPDREGHFINIGQIHNNVIPVSFYGVR